MDDFDRFMTMIEVAPNDCWLWQGEKDAHGYAIFRPENSRSGRHKVPGYRWIYEQTHGAIPAGFAIDHLCHTHPCVNPNHLEAVTIVENLTRRPGPIAHMARESHCELGHRYPQSDSEAKSGVRVCQECMKMKVPANAIFTTIGGTIVSLEELDGEQSKFLTWCIAVYRGGVDWAIFRNAITGCENPLVRSSGGIITTAIYNHPLFQAVNDLSNRLGIVQGFLRWDRPLLEPFGDEWLPVSHAAALKGVSVQAIHLAIGRGEIVATGTTRKQVSRRSLEAWAPVAVRQKAGFARAERAQESSTEETK